MPLLHWDGSRFSLLKTKGPDTMRIELIMAFCNMFSYTQFVSCNCNIKNNRVKEAIIIGSNRENENNMKRECAIWIATVLQRLFTHSFKHANMSYRISANDFKQWIRFIYFDPNVPVRCLHCSKPQSLWALVWTTSIPY